MAEHPMKPRRPSVLSLSIVLGISVTILTGCALTPATTLTPEADRPETVSSVEHLEEYTSANLPAEDAVVDQWWRMIGDAEIDSLIHELRLNSLTLTETRLQIAQAREQAVQARSFRLPSVNGSVDTSGNGSRSPNSSFDFNDAYGLALSADFNLSLIHISEPTRPY